MFTVSSIISDESIYNDLKQLIEDFIIQQFPEIANDKETVEKMAAPYQRILKQINNSKTKYNELTKIKGVKKFFSILRKLKRGSKIESKIYYITADEDVDGKSEKRVCAFQLAQVSEENGEKIGWRTIAFTKEKYRGRLIDGKFISVHINDEVTKWFEQEKVSIEKTTAKAESKNLRVYIKKFGFEKIGEKNGVVYLEKRIRPKIDNSHSKTFEFVRLGFKILNKFSNKFKNFMEKN